MLCLLRSGRHSTVRRAESGHATFDSLAALSDRDVVFVFLNASPPRAAEHSDCTRGAAAVTHI